MPLTRQALLEIFESSPRSQASAAGAERLPLATAWIAERSR
jgi:hypothetical protein